MRLPQLIKDFLPLVGILGISLNYLQKVLTYTFDRQATGALLKFGPFSYFDWGVLITLGASLLLYSEVKTVLRRRLVIAIGIITFFSIMIGIPQAMTRSLAVNDIRITLAFGSGLCFILMLRHSRFWHWHLVLLQVCLVVLMYKAYKDVTFGEFFVAGISGGSRATVNSVAALTGATLAVTWILITFASLRSVLILPVAFALFLPVAYMGVISSGSRSVIIYLAAAMACSLYVRAYGTRGGGLAQFPSVGRVVGLACTAVLFGGLFVFRFRHFVYEQLLLLFSRFKGEGMADDSSSLRVLELEALFADMGILDWVWGRGVGGAFPSPIYDGVHAPTLHVGVFTFLLKFGLPIFIVVACFLYAYWPWRFLRALFVPQERNASRREAVLVVFPCTVSLVGALSLSGGYGTGSFTWWGVLYGCYLFIERDGLKSFTSAKPGLSGRLS